MSHTCHANFCNTPCRPTLLMCARHWAMVSATTKTRVLDHYRPGQCRDMRPSREWIDAAHTAVAEVANAEGKPMSRHQRSLLGFGVEQATGPQPHQQGEGNVD